MSITNATQLISPAAMATSACSRQKSAFRKSDWHRCMHRTHIRRPNKKKLCETGITSQLKPGWSNDGESSVYETSRHNIEMHHIASMFLNSFPFRIN